MIDPIIAPLISFVATALLIVILRPVAIAIGLTDKPGQRKRHEGEVPLIGGIAIFLAVALALVAGSAAPGTIYPQHLAFLIAGLLLVVTGAYDDMHELSPLIRFCAQACAALVMVYWGGVVLNNLGELSADGALVTLGWLAVPFTLFATIGVINAVNMSDGLDGLSGNLSLVTLLGYGIANSIWGSSETMPLINVVSAGIAGFLIFNQRMIWRSKASVFLGDAGSMMLGLFLTWTAIEISQGADRILSPAASLWFLTIPIYDTVRVMLRRLLQGRSPFAADSNHLHHMFIRTGYRVSETIAIICLLAAAGCAVGLTAEWTGMSQFALVLAFVLGGIVYCLVLERAWRRMQFLGRPINEL